MPNVIQGSPATGTILTSGDMGYKYPFDLDLKPGSQLHSKIIAKLSQYAEDSYTVMSKRHGTWNEIDKTLKVFIPLSEAEKLIKGSDSRKPTSIVVPYSYATLETMLAYMMRAFLSGDIFLFDGVGPEDTIPAKLLELVVNQQVRRFKSTLDIYASLRDSLSYGIGATTLNWKEVWGKKPQRVDIPQFDAFGLPLPPRISRENIPALLFEGNECINIDPYRLLPDPNTSIHNLQSMEYIGWIDFISMNRLLAGEAEGSRINVKYLNQQGAMHKSSKYFSDPSKRIMTREEREAPNSTKYVTEINFYCEIIPKDWGLKGVQEGNERGEYPEKWMFSMANEEILTRISPLGLNHNKYPISVAAPDFDGYSITPLARMELVGGLQTALDFMFNSHVANVRKAMNDMLIVDPSLINMDDLKNPEPGKLIRLRRSAWGRGVTGAVEQLKVVDITQKNMSDAEQIMGMMARATGASDSTQGIVQDRGERVSASEFNGAMNMAISRLDRMAKIISVQYLQDLATFHASHTQQLMSNETFVKAVGDWPQELVAEFGRDYGNKMNVSPFDILADYDVVYKDGTTKSASQTEVQFWIETMKLVSSDPVLNQTFDIARIFSHVARANGATNVNDFIRRTNAVETTQMADSQVTGEAQKGNLIDMQEFMQMRG